MTLLQQLYSQNKDRWFTRFINGYKEPVYYRFDGMGVYNVEIILLRYYPKTGKWQKDSIERIEFLDSLEIVEDEEVIASLNAEYALLLLTRKDNS